MYSFLGFKSMYEFKWQREVCRKKGRKWLERKQKPRDLIYKGVHPMLRSQLEPGSLLLHPPFPFPFLSACSLDSLINSP